MKLTQSDIGHLNSILNVCNLVDISAFILSEKGIRGVNGSKSCAIIEDNSKTPKIEGSAMLGLNNLKILKQRLDLFKNDAKFNIEAKQKANGDFTHLDIKGSNASVMFRVTNPVKIKAPIGIDDTAVKNIIITREEAQLILNAEKAMSADKLTIYVSTDNSVRVEFADKENDIFVIDLSNKAISVNEATSFTSYYFADVFSPLLRAAAAEREEIEVNLFEASAQIAVDGYKLILLSPMDSD